jgi:hypothetical protein
MRFGIWYQDKSKVVSWYQICVSVCKGSEVVFREAASGWWWRHCRGVFEWSCTSRPWKPEQTGTIWMCQTENKASYIKRASVHTKWQCPSNYWNLGKVIMGVNSTLGNWWSRFHLWTIMRSVVCDNLFEWFIHYLIEFAHKVELVWDAVQV